MWAKGFTPLYKRRASGTPKWSKTSSTHSLAIWSWSGARNIRGHPEKSLKRKVRNDCHVLLLVFPICPPKVSRKNTKQVWGGVDDNVFLGGTQWHIWRYSCKSQQCSCKGLATNSIGAGYYRAISLRSDQQLLPGWFLCMICSSRWVATATRFFPDLANSIPVSNIWVPWLTSNLLCFLVVY